MGITSLQVCIDSSDWLQATVSEDRTGMDTSSPVGTPTGDDTAIHNLTCSRPLIERQLRPPHELGLKCPRCDSTHTKFCYYNNYSLSQPRYFCKTCRRYWTKGGTLRNIPVGGGCRKIKKSPSSSCSGGGSASSKNKHPSGAAAAANSTSTDSVVRSSAPPMLCYDYNGCGGGFTDLQLAFPEQLQFSGMFGHGGNPNFPIEFMDGKYDALTGGGHEFVAGGGADSFSPIGNGEFVAASGNFHGFCSPLGFSALELGSSSAAGGIGVLESYQPYDQQDQGEIDVKPPKMLSIEWNDHQQACNSDAGYGLGSWTGLMNGYGSSTTNPLV